MSELKQVPLTPGGSRLLPIVSLCLGVASVIPLYDAMLLFAIPAMVTGFLAIRYASRPTRLGKRLAQVGIALGIASFTFVMLYWLTLGVTGKTFGNQHGSEFFFYTRAIFHR